MLEVLEFFKKNIFDYYRNREGNVKSLKDKSECDITKLNKVPYYAKISDKAFNANPLAAIRCSLVTLSCLLSQDEVECIDGFVISNDIVTTNGYTKKEIEF